MKLVKKVLPVLAAAALVVTTVPTVTVWAAPNAIATYDFENGTSGMSDSGLGGPAPAVTQDGERGNVLQFNGGSGSSYTAGNPTQNSTKIDPGTPSSMKLDTNPFAGKSLTGATISMWVKAPSGAAEDGAGLVGFVSKEYSGLEHPDRIYTDNTTDELISGQYCYGIGVGAFDDVLLTSAMVYFGGFLGNTMWIQDWDQTYVSNADKWVFMVVTLGNNAADNKVYIDGNMIAQAGPEWGNTIGKRFNHGEAHTTDTEANKHEPLMMEVLTAADTVAYFGYTGSMGAANGVCIDDVTFYDSIASDSDVMTMTQNAKNSAPGGGNNENPSAADNSNNNNDNNAADGGNQTNNTNTSNKTATSTKSPAASAKAATNNQNLPQTGVVSTGVLVACGAAVVAGGAMLFKKKEKEEE